MDYPHISVNKILDSTNSGSRVTTFVLTYPRYIHAEFMMHRMFSRNAQSSRAIPCQQWADRLLEPFDTITVIVTATEWENFFALRCAEDAQPEINHLAWMMAEQYYEGEPPEERDIHLPFISGEREKQIKSYVAGWGPGPIATHVKIQVSAACCARVSYLSFDGVIDIQKDIALYGRLIESGHMTPMEHQCIATPGEQYANLRGWRSHRNMLPTEIKTFNYEEAKRNRIGG